MVIKKPVTLMIILKEKKMITQLIILDGDINYYDFVIFHVIFWLDNSEFYYFYQQFKH
jgi:hypothetical protein